MMKAVRAAEKRPACERSWSAENLRNHAGKWDSYEDYDRIKPNKYIFQELFHLFRFRNALSLALAKLEINIS
jgi:hypothetical protein